MAPLEEGRMAKRRHLTNARRGAPASHPLLHMILPPPAAGTTYLPGRLCLPRAASAPHIALLNAPAPPRAARCGASAAFPCLSRRRGATLGREGREGGGTAPASICHIVPAMPALPVPYLYRHMRAHARHYHTARHRCLR